jgi:hypothetical protein
MHVIEYIKGEFASVHRAVERVMKDVTHEMFNWASPGTANTISATFLHLMSVEDHFIQKVIQGKPTRWESDGWSEKTGVQKPPGIGEDWSAYKSRQILMQPLMDYTEAVFAATQAYLAALTENDLDRMVKFASGERSVADMLRLSVSQSHSHVGEIAALKGIQGKQGLAF